MPTYINQATLEELTSISGIGEKRTQKILNKKQEKESNLTLSKHSLIWPTFEHFIVSHGQHANFLPESCLIDFIAIDC
jgi:predicted DNA-binding helix-hairpin-helix protein